MGRLRREEAEAGEPRLLVIEDGGFFTPRLLRDPELSRRTLGAVEQTTKGLWNDQDAIREGHTPLFPILSLPDSRIKRGFEPPHIADGTVRAVQNMLGHLTLRNKVAAVIGCGSIGSALICSLAGHGVAVRFYDESPAALVNATVYCGTAAESAEEAAAGADLVFGATGHRSITDKVIDGLKSGTWVVSVSSARVEIDLDYLNRRATDRRPIPPAAFHRAGGPERGDRYQLHDGRQEDPPRTRRRHAHQLHGLRRDAR